MALLGPVLVTLLRINLETHIPGVLKLSLFSVPVLLAALTGGILPGVACLLNCLVLGTFFFLSPDFSFRLRNPEDAYSLASFALTQVIVCLVCDAVLARGRSERQALLGRQAFQDQVTELLDRMTDGFFVIDRTSWMVRSVNTAAHALSHDEQNPLGRSIWNIFPELNAEVLGPQLEEVTESPQMIACEFQLKEGDSRWLLARFFPSRQGETIALFVQDITSRKDLDHAREQLLTEERAIRSDLEQESRNKDDFLAMLSHELRTPMTAILGWSEYLQDRGGFDKPATDALESIDRAARLQASLIDELLDVSRIISGQLSMHWEIIDAEEIMEDVLREMTPRAQEGQRHLLFEPSPDHLAVRGDAFRLHQIVTNLVANAIKFTSPGGHIILALRGQESDVVIEVKDDGEGLESHFLPHVFDRFRQANSSTSRKHGGLGLGLSIVKQLVEAHEGEVTAHSNGLGQGATFQVRLPRARSLPTYSVPAPPEPVSLTGVCIVLVEDDEPTRVMFEKVLSHRGANVYAAASADEALEILSRVSPAVLISDIGMPGVDGYELVRRVRQSADSALSSVPALALTAFGRDGEREQAMEAGFNAHLMKSIEISKLVATIAHLAQRIKADDH